MEKEKIVHTVYAQRSLLLAAYLFKAIEVTKAEAEIRSDVFQFLLSLGVLRILCNNLV